MTEIYPNISYFILLKDLVNIKAGTQVDICRAESRVCLCIHNDNEYTELPIRFAENKEWFKPISNEEHKRIFKENTIKWLIETQGEPVETAEETYNQIIKKNYDRNTQKI